MPTTDDVRWFKTQFSTQINAAIAGTPLTEDLLVAIACQETGYLWGPMRRKGLPVNQILALCVGDTLDADKGRGAFPRTKAELVAAPRGAEMFVIAHQALVDMAAHIETYAAVAKRPNKFCHGFGVFQLDLQFFLDDPDYFLNRDYVHFDQALARCVGELGDAVRKLKFEERTDLSDLELAALGIVYNTGGYKPSKGLKQGYFDGDRFYGENLFDFLRLAHTVGVAPILPAAASGQAVIAQPTSVKATGPAMRVKTLDGMLRLRSEPNITEKPQANVIANLPDGHPVRAVSGQKVRGFIEIETSLSGAFFRGFCSAKYLDVIEGDISLAPITVATTPPTSGIVAVTMPRKPGTVTRRMDRANAHSLNEVKQPSRVGSTPDELRAELARIIQWLGVDDQKNLRYQPHDGLTFCNIYAHDYCTLANVYLPRVWWTTGALLKIAAGEPVEPLYGETIHEVRANDLFRWFRDFGPAFGWRQTGTLTKLQTEVNQGAIGVIVARRKEDGRSGHIVMVVPETSANVAKRNGAGEVTSPLQSQAGATNFRYGTGKQGWWKGEQFAEFAFWLHA